MAVRAIGVLQNLPKLQPTDTDPEEWGWDSGEDFDYVIEITASHNPGEGIPSFITIRVRDENLTQYSNCCPCCIPEAILSVVGYGQTVRIDGITCSDHKYRMVWHPGQKQWEIVAGDFSGSTFLGRWLQSETIRVSGQYSDRARIAIEASYTRQWREGCFSDEEYLAQLLAVS